MKKYKAPAPRRAGNTQRGQRAIGQLGAALRRLDDGDALDLVSRVVSKLAKKRSRAASIHRE